MEIRKVQRIELRKDAMVKYGVLSLLALALFVANLDAQLGLGDGRIKGMIYDESGQPIPDAQIEVMNLTYETKFVSASDKKGRWAISGLASGWYRVTVKKSGYQDATVEFQLSLIGQKVHTLDVTLHKEGEILMQNTAGQKPPAHAVLLSEGIELYNQNRYQDALDKFERFIKEQPEIYQVYINIGNCFLAMKDYGRAIDAYSRFIDRVKSEKGALEGDENVSRVLATIGKAYLDQGNIDKAKEYFRLAVDTFPNDAVLAYNVGEICFNQNEIDQAIEYLLIAVKIKGEWPEPHLKLGYAYLNKGKYKLALESLHNFLKLAPNHPQAPSVRTLLPRLEELAKKEQSNFF